VAELTIEERVAAEEEFGKKLGPYVGQWIAVKDHEVIAHSEDFEELLAHVELPNYDYIFKVLPRGTRIY
jgi:hypothetical protein